MNTDDVEKIISAHRNYIFDIAYKLTLDIHHAEDLSQETFVRFLEKHEQIIDADKIRFWLRKTCVNLFLMSKRKEKLVSTLSINEESFSSDLERQLVDESPTALDEVIVEEMVRDIQNGCFMAMCRYLSLEQRITFSLHDMFGVSIADISATLDVSEGAVKGLLYRGRRNIFNFFSGHCEWIDKANSCRCSAWQQFVSDKKMLKEEVKKLETNLAFRENPEEKNISESQRKKILYLYRNIPEQKPLDDWYKKVVLAVKK